jgi:hypothetical protein
MLPINRNPSPRVLTSFRRIWFPLFVALIGSVLWWRLGLPRAAVWAWAVGAVLAVASLASARLARAVFVGLQLATYPIGLVVSTVALAVIFYGLLTPLGWFMRLAGRDPLRLRDRTVASHWQPCHQDDDPAHAFRQF